MSLDKSLKSKAALARRRNVLSRAERLKTLQDEELWQEEQSVFGLPKVKVARVRRPGKKKAKEAAPEPETAAEEQEAGEAERQE